MYPPILVARGCSLSLWVNLVADGKWRHTGHNRDKCMPNYGRSPDSGDSWTVSRYHKCPIFTEEMPIFMLSNPQKKNCRGNLTVLPCKRHPVWLLSWILLSQCIQYRNKFPMPLTTVIFHLGRIFNVLTAPANVWRLFMWVFDQQIWWNKVLVNLECQYHSTRFIWANNMAYSAQMRSNKWFYGEGDSFRGCIVMWEEYRSIAHVVRWCLVVSLLILWRGYVWKVSTSATRCLTPASCTDGNGPP